MANISVDNKCGCLYFYSKKGLSQPCYLTHGKTSIGSSLQCNIRIKGVEEIFCILDSNDAGFTVLVNTYEDERILLNGVYAQKYTVLTHDDHFQLGDKKFKYCKPDMNEKDLECIRKTVATRMNAGNFKRQLTRNSTFVSPLKRLQRPSPRRFSTGSNNITELNFSATVSERNRSSGKNSTPQSASKSRFSQRMARPRHSALGALKENEMLEFQNDSEKLDSGSYSINKMFSKEESSKAEFKTPTPKKNMSTAVNLREVDLNSTVSSCCSPAPTRKKMYSGNLSDVSDFTTPENNVSAVSITPLNVSKKTTASMNKSALAYADLKVESSTPKSAVRRRQSSAMYRPIVEEITPVSPVPRSSLRISSLTKPSFTQRRSVNFNMSSSLENSIGVYAKRKRSQSDISGITLKEKIAKNNEQEIDIVFVKDSDDEIEAPENVGASIREENTSRYQRSTTRTVNYDSSDSDDFRVSLTRKDTSGHNYIDNSHFATPDRSIFGTSTNRKSSLGHKYRKSSVCLMLDQTPETSKRSTSKSSERQTMDSSFDAEEDGVASFDDGTFDALHDNDFRRTPRIEEKDPLEASVGKNSLRSRGNVSLTSSTFKTPEKSPGRRSLRTLRSDKRVSADAMDSSFDAADDEVVASSEEGTFGALHDNISYRNSQIDEMDPIEASVGKNSLRNRGNVSLTSSTSKTPKKSTGRKSVRTPKSEKQDSADAMDSSLDAKDDEVDVEDDKVVASSDDGPFDAWQNNLSNRTPQIDEMEHIEASASKNSVRSRGNVSLTLSNSKTPKKSTEKRSVRTPRSEKRDSANAMDSSFDAKDDEVIAIPKDGTFDALRDNISHRTPQIDEMDPIEASVSKNSLRSRGNVSLTLSNSKTPRKSTGRRSVRTPRSEKLDFSDVMDSSFDAKDDEVIASPKDGTVDTLRVNLSHRTPQIDERSPIEASVSKNSLRDRSSVSLMSSTSKTPKKSTGRKSVRTPRSEKRDFSDVMDSSFDTKDDEVIGSPKDGTVDTLRVNLSHRTPQIDERGPIEASVSRNSLRDRSSVSLMSSTSKTPKKSTGRKSVRTSRSEKRDFSDVMDSSFDTKDDEVIGSPKDGTFDALRGNRSHRTPQIDEMGRIEGSVGKNSLRSRGNISLTLSTSKTPKKSTGRRSVRTPRSDKLDCSDVMDSSFDAKDDEVIGSPKDGTVDTLRVNLSHRTPQIDERGPIETSVVKNSLRSRSSVSLMSSTSKTPKKSTGRKSIRTPRSEKRDIADAMDSSFDAKNDNGDGCFDADKVVASPQIVEVHTIEASVGKNSLRSRGNVSLTSSTFETPEKSSGKRSLRTLRSDKRDSADAMDSSFDAADDEVVASSEDDAFGALHDNISHRTSQIDEMDPIDASVGKNSLRTRANVSLTSSTSKTPKKSTGRKSVRTPKFDITTLSDAEKIPLPSNYFITDKRSSAKMNDENDDNALSDSFCLNLSHSEVSTQSGRISRSTSRIDNMSIFDDSLELSSTDIKFARGSSTPMALNRSKASKRVSSSATVVTSKRTRSNLRSKSLNFARKNPRSVKITRKSVDSLSNSLLARRIQGLSVSVTKSVKSPLKPSGSSVVSSPLSEASISTRATFGSGKRSSKRSSGNSSIEEDQISFDATNPSTSITSEKIPHNSKGQISASKKLKSTPEHVSVSNRLSRSLSNASKTHNLSVVASDKSLSGVPPENTNNKLFTSITSETHEFSAGEVTSPAESSDISEQDSHVVTPDASTADSELSKTSNSIIYSFLDSSLDTSLTGSVSRRSSRLTRPSIDERIYEIPKTKLNLSSRKSNKSLIDNKFLESSVAEGVDRIPKTTQPKDPTDITATEAIFCEFLESPRKTPRMHISSKSEKRISVNSALVNVQNDPTDITGLRRLLKTPTATTLKNDTSNAHSLEKLRLSAKVQNSSKAEQRVRRQKSSENYLTETKETYDFLKTSKVRGSPRNDLTNIPIIKTLFKTPKVHNLPKNDLTVVAGVKRLLRTPKEQNSPKNDLTKIIGVKKLMQTPKEQNSPKNDLTQIIGVKKLMTTPKQQNSPKNDLTQIIGVKKLMATPKQQNSPKNDLTQIIGVKKLMQTPKEQNSPKNDLTNVSGVKKILRTPKQKISRNIQSSPKNDLTNISGVERLLKTPSKQNSPKKHLTNKLSEKKLTATLKQQKSPENDLSDVRGVKRLLKTPKVHTGPRNSDLNNFEISGIDKLFNESIDNTFDNLFDKKPLRTYSSPKKQRQSNEHVPELKSPSEEISNKNHDHQLITNHGSSRSRRGQKQLYNSIVESVPTSDVSVKDIVTPASSTVARSPSKYTPKKNDALELILLLESSRSRRGQRKLHGPMVELDSTSDLGVNATSTPVCSAVYDDNLNGENTHSDNISSEVKSKRGRKEGVKKRKVGDSSDETLRKSKILKGKDHVTNSNERISDSKVSTSDANDIDEVEGTKFVGKSTRSKKILDKMNEAHKPHANERTTRAKTTRKIDSDSFKETDDDNTTRDAKIKRSKTIMKENSKASKLDVEEASRGDKDTVNMKVDETIMNNDSSGNISRNRTRRGRKVNEKNSIGETETRDGSLDDSSRTRAKTRKVKALKTEDTNTKNADIKTMDTKTRKGKKGNEMKNVNETETDIEIRKMDAKTRKGKRQTDEAEKYNVPSDKNSIIIEKTLKNIQENEEIKLTDTDEANIRKGTKDIKENTVYETRTKTRKMKYIVEDDEKEKNSTIDVENKKLRTKTRLGKNEKEKNTVLENEPYNISLENSSRTRTRTRRVKDIIVQDNEETTAKDVEETRAKTKISKKEAEKITDDENEKYNISLEKNLRTRKNTRRVKDIVQDNEEMSTTDIGNEKLGAKTGFVKKELEKNTSVESESYNISMEKSSRTRTRTRRVKDIVQDNEKASATDIKKLEAKTSKGKKESKKNTVDENEINDVSLDHNSRTKTKTRGIKDTIQVNIETSVSKVDTKKLRTKTRSDKKNIKEIDNDDDITHAISSDDKKRTESTTNVDNNKKTANTRRTNKNSSIEELKADEDDVPVVGRNKRANRGQNSKYDEMEWDTPVKTPKNKVKKNVTFDKNSKLSTPVALNDSQEGLRRSRRRK